MARKISDSILRGLDKLRKNLVGTPAKAKPQSPAGKPKPRPRAAAPSKQAESPADTAQAPEEKPEKKKAANKPWYHHRQRW